MAKINLTPEKEQLWYEEFNIADTKGYKQVHFIGEVLVRDRQVDKYCYVTIVRTTNKGYAIICANRLMETLNVVFRTNKQLKKKNLVKSTELQYFSGSRLEAVNDLLIELKLTI